MSRKIGILVGIILITGYLSSLAGPLTPGGNHGKGKSLNSQRVPGIRGTEKQGGDTFSDAFVIPDLPFFDTGTTEGFVNDYQQMCPYGTSGPDVVYSFTPPWSMTISVDLCGSDFDTKVYVWDSGGGFVACNDDFYSPGDPCGDWVSWIGEAELIGGETFFIIVDGSSNGDFGEYQILVEEVIACEFECPPAGIAEGEPQLHDFYHDNYNSGCAGDGTAFFVLPSGNESPMVFCGKSGWYTGDNGWPKRDTDWFVATIGSNGYLEFEVESEQNYFFQEVGPQDCSNYGIIQEVHGSACQSRTMTVVGQPGSTAWLWFAPMTWEPPDGFVGHEFDYQLNISGGLVATEVRSWGNLKRMYGTGPGR